MVSEHSPPTNVARVRFSDPASHDWAEFVGSLSCSGRFFSGFSGFPLSPKTNISPTRPHKLTALNCTPCINKVSLPSLPDVMSNQILLVIYNPIQGRKEGRRI